MVISCKAIVVLWKNADFNQRTFQLILGTLQKLTDIIGIESITNWRQKVRAHTYVALTEN